MRALVGQHDTCPVRAIFRQRKGTAADLDVEWVKGDILDKESLVTAFTGAKVVFHLASLVSIDPREAKEVHISNVSGTRNVVEAALECGVKRLIYFSSIHAYNQYPLDEVLDESRDYADGLRQDAYARSKAAAEVEVRRAIDRGLDAVILTPTGVVGPFDGRPSYMGQFFLDLHRRKIPVQIAGGFDFVDVRNVIDATVAAETQGRCGENYILSGSWHSMRNLGLMSQQATGVPAPRLVLPMFVARFWAPFQVILDRSRGRRPLYTSTALRFISCGNRRISSAKAQAELGFRSRPLADSVRDAYRWFEERGMLGGNGGDD